MKDKTEIGMSPRQIAKQTGLSSSKVIELLNLNGYECSLNEKVDIRIVRGINRLYPFVKQYDSLTGETIELKKNIDLIENTMYNSNTKLFSSLRTEELQKAIINLQRESMIDPEQIKRLEEAIQKIKDTEEALELEKQELEKRKKELDKLEKLHKQPRSLLKTIGQSISNTTDAPTLFSLPQRVELGGGAIGELKEEISKNTGALAFYLIQQYQENNNKPLVITNLKDIAEVMNCNNYRLKLYLLYLGGYVYPIVDSDEETKELVLTNEQLFKIEFRYSQKVADKYPVNTRGQIQGVERIGTDLASFIKDEPLDRVIITPSQRFIKALEGKGLGNILTVNNKFVGLILELTDIATKILCYSSSNQPSQKIKEDNLVKHLGLTKQIKKQGKPRVRATILKGLQELKDKEHIKSYSYEEATGMYSYTYSDKYVRFKESKKTKKDPIGGVQ